MSGGRDGPVWGGFGDCFVFSAHRGGYVLV